MSKTEVILSIKFHFTGLGQETVELFWGGVGGLHLSDPSVGFLSNDKNVADISTWLQGLSSAS
jgi:hypothetical protein